MKVAIVGSREYPNLKSVRDYISGLHPYDQVVSGGARGVDSYAERCAIFFGLDVMSFPADWKAHGKSAGFIRNKQIVDFCDRVVAFWDGKSRGTMHTVDIARRAGKPVEVYDSAGEPLKTAVAPWVGTATQGQKQGHGGSHAAPAADNVPSQGQVLGLTAWRERGRLVR